MMNFHCLLIADIFSYMINRSFSCVYYSAQVFRRMIHHRVAPGWCLCCLASSCSELNFKAILIFQTLCSDHITSEHKGHTHTRTDCFGRNPLVLSRMFVPLRLWFGMLQCTDWLRSFCACHYQTNTKHLKGTGCDYSLLLTLNRWLCAACFC